MIRRLLAWQSGCFLGDVHKPVTQAVGHDHGGSVLGKCRHNERRSGRHLVGLEDRLRRGDARNSSPISPILPPRLRLTAKGKWGERSDFVPRSRVNIARKR